MRNFLKIASVLVGTPGTMFYVNKISEEQERAFKKLPDETRLKADFLREKYRYVDFDGNPYLRLSLQNFTAKDEEEFRQWKWQQAHSQKNSPSSRT